MKTRVAHHVAIYLFIALTGYGIGACRQNVMLNPSEDDLLVLNGCVVPACNYLAAVKTQHTLEKNFWAKILLVRYVNHPAGHAYCVWETDGTIYGYDRNAGGFPIPVYTRDAKAIAIVLAQELSKHLHENLSVSHANRSKSLTIPQKLTSISYSTFTGGRSIPRNRTASSPISDRAIALLSLYRTRKSERSRKHQRRSWRPLADSINRL